MKALYDIDLDYLEVVDENIKNYGEPVGGSLILFRSEESGDTVGFGLEGATENLELLRSLPVRMKLAGLMKMVRKLENLRQDEMETRTGVSLRTLQRAEAGEANISLENLASIARAFPGYDFSILLREQDQKSA